MTLVDPSDDRDTVVLTAREADLMNVLWRLGSGTVAEVQAALEDELAYTTVLTILRTLEKKGYVGHESEGRAHRYRPLIEQQRARTGALERLTRKLFGGSPELLVAHLLEGRGLEEDQLRKLRELVDHRLEGEDS